MADGDAQVMAVAQMRGAPDGPQQFVVRQQPARFGWWSDRSLMIVKGDETMTLDADDIRALARFVEGCNAVDQL